MVRILFTIFTKWGSDQAEQTVVPLTFDGNRVKLDVCNSLRDENIREIAQNDSTI